MLADRTVEVVCEHCDGKGEYQIDEGSWTQCICLPGRGIRYHDALLVPGSLAALKLELAEAYMRALALDDDSETGQEPDLIAARSAVAAAARAVRNHPSYRAADAAKGEKDG